MTAEQEFFIMLSRSAVFDEDPPLPPEDIDWQYIWNKAYEQNISGLLASTILKLPKDKQPPNAAQWRSIMIQTMVIMSQKNAEFERMSAKLKENQIDPICLKGCVLKDLYPDPALRVMGDFDVLIEKQQRKTAEAVFENNGYKINRNTLFSALDNGTAHWEIFESLEDDFRDDPLRWNRELEKHAVTNHKGLRVLDPTFELTYVVVHASKHMTREGCGIRNMLDVALILQHRIKDINFGKVYEICKSQKYEGIFLYFLSAAKKWFEIDIGYDKTMPDPDKFLEFLLSYGVFGRELDGKILAGQVVRREGSSVGPLRRIFFPPRKMIQHKYQYVKKSPLLLPIAWMHRFFYAVFVRKFSVKDMVSGLRESLEYGTERKNRLKELNIR